MWIYLNDKFVTQEEALISVFDHGFLYGDGVFETIRSYGNRIFMGEQHLARLFRSAEAIGLQIPISAARCLELLRESMTQNDVGNARQDAYLRITVSRGAGDIGLDPSLCPSPTVTIIARPLIPPAASLYEKGIPLIIAATKRNLPAALSPSIKSTNFLNNILAKREAIAAGAFDSVLLNWEQHLTECTASNLFFVTHEVLRTPSLDCGLLDGITRAIVIELAKELRIRVEEGRFTAKELYGATECFLTNTTMEIMPVASVDGSMVGRGSPGSVTRTLQERFIAARQRFLEQLPSR